MVAVGIAFPLLPTVEGSAGIIRPLFFAVWWLCSDVSVWLQFVFPQWFMIMRTSFEFLLAIDRDTFLTTAFKN